MTDRDTYYNMSKWEWFVEGFRNISYIIDSYETVEHFPDDFWEAINFGYYEMYIFPYDDWYNPTISKERQLRLGQRPKPPFLCERMEEIFSPFDNDENWEATEGQQLILDAVCNYSAQLPYGWSYDD